MGCAGMGIPMGMPRWVGVLWFYAVPLCAAAIFHPAEFTGNDPESPLRTTHAQVFHQGPIFRVHLGGKVTPNNWAPCYRSHCRGEITMVVYDSNRVVAMNQTRYGENMRGGALTLKASPYSSGNTPETFSLDLTTKMRRGGNGQ